MIPYDALSEVAIRLVAAMLIGAAIGLDREVRRRPAGMRTHSLVSLGAALLVVMVVRIPPGGHDPIDALSRVIQGIVVGVGFLGGGTILKNEHDKEVVHGLTTAATIWVTAALGAACGAGQWIAAIIAALLAILVVTVGRAVERLVHRIFRDPPPPSGQPNNAK